MSKPTHLAYQVVEVAKIRCPDTLIASVWRRYGYMWLCELEDAKARVVLDQPFWYQADQAFFAQLQAQGIIGSYEHFPIAPSRE